MLFQWTLVELAIRGERSAVRDHQLEMRNPDGRASQLIPRQTSDACSSAACLCREIHGSPCSLGFNCRLATSIRTMDSSGKIGPWRGCVDLWSCPNDRGTTLAISTGQVVIQHDSRHEPQR
jgi:hypothetical protein